MLQIFKRRSPPKEETSPPAPAEAAPAIAETAEKKGFWQKLTHGLHRTRTHFTDGLAHLILGKKVIDADLLEALETQLILADVGIEATGRIIADLTAQIARNQLSDPAALLNGLKNELLRILQPCSQPLVIDSVNHQPHVILLVGVNGSGKTTTIGKLAKRLQLQGEKVILAAGDTFRAAAVEQLQAWGKKNQIPVILPPPEKGDCAAVIYDGILAAKSGGFNVLIADTAGRLHTQNNLMDELKKVKRVINKLDASAPHEVLLVLDAGIGQNALVQAQQFHQAIGITGLVVTKLDGTAKGGIIFAIADKLKLPIRFIGVGEGIDDLQAFAAEDFVNALFSEQEI